MKNILLGFVLPLALLLAGVGLYRLVPAPVPPQRQLPKPDDRTALLSFVPEAQVAQVYDLRQHSETLNVVANGTVVPFREINIAAEAAGRIVEKNPQVRSGNFVPKGEVLFKIDPRDYELEVERLSRLLEQEKASLRELDQDVQNAQDLLAVAEEQLKLSEGEVKRLEGLNRNVASLSELDSARQSRLTSMNTVVTQKNQIRTLETRKSRLTIATQLAETQLEQANLNLSRCTVTAPANGRVVMDQVEVDSFVQRGTQLISLEDTEKVEIAVSLRMDQLFWVLDQPEMSTDELVNAAQASRYELPATPVEVDFRVTGRDAEIYRWQGVLDRFEGAGLDPQSRTVPIRIRVDKPAEFQVLNAATGAVVNSGDRPDRRGPPMLVRGMFVDARIKTKPTTPLLLIPKLGIKPSSPNNSVWKFSPDADAVFETNTAKLAMAEQKRATEKAKEEGSPAPQAASDAEGTEDSEALVVDDWNTGYLKVVDDVRMISEYWGQLPNEPDQEYWVCEAPQGLSAGDMVITTPMPGIKADGTDPVRFSKQSPAPLPADASVASEQQSTETQNTTKLDSQAETES